jgi:hypothetical protein
MFFDMTQIILGKAPTPEMNAIGILLITAGLAGDPFVSMALDKRWNAAVRSFFQK